MTRPRLQQLSETAALVLKVAALVAVVWGGVQFIASASATVALAQSSAKRVDMLNARVDSLENGNAAVSYMTCVTFSESHPAPQVPTYCDKYTRQP